MAKKKSAKKKTSAKKSPAKKSRTAGAKKRATKKKPAKAAPKRKTTKTSKSKPPKRSAKKTKPKTTSKSKAAKKKPAKPASRRASPKSTRAKSDVGSAVPEAPARRAKKPSARQLAKIRELLFRKRESIRSHLETELLELEKPEEKHHRADLEEVASDTHEKDSLCEILDIGASQIGQIEVALQKIENGTYGICEDCNEEIPPARLEALPFASQCIECKRKAEQGTASSRFGY